MSWTTEQPEFHAGVDVWHLPRFLGRRIWARPHEVASTTSPQWVVLEDVWVEKNPTDTLFIAAFTWGGEQRSARLLPTGVITVELTEDEWATVAITELGRDMRSIRYEPDWTVKAPPVRIVESATTAGSPTA